DENAFYYNWLATEEWDKARARIIHRAKAARAQALRDLAGVVLRPLRIAATAVAAAAGNWWHAYALRRERNAAVRELRALDDRTLQDIGVNRREIEWGVDGHDDTCDHRGQPFPQARSGSGHWYDLEAPAIRQAVDQEARRLGRVCVEKNRRAWRTRSAPSPARTRACPSSALKAA